MEPKDPAKKSRREKREPPAPDWTPPGRPAGETPPGVGQPARKGDDVGPGPAKLGDPPIEEPFGNRSRHGGSGGGLDDPR